MKLSFNLLGLIGGLACIAVSCWLGVVELLVYGQPHDTFWTLSLLGLYLGALLLYRWQGSNFFRGFARFAFLHLLLELAMSYGLLSTSRITNIVLLAVIAAFFSGTTVALYYHACGLVAAATNRHSLEEDLNL